MANRLRYPVLCAVLMMALPGCSSDRDEKRLSARERQMLQTSAGQLVDYLLSGRLDLKPDSASVAEVIELCEHSPQGYVYFYQCASESISSAELPRPDTLSQP